MKIAIVSITRTHLLNLAIALDKKEDVDVVFYTMSPKFRLRKFGYQGKVVSCFFPIGVLSYATKFLTKKMSFDKRLRIGHKFRKWFDKTISYLIKPCDVIIGNNGDAYYTSKKARREFKPIVICDQGSTHILEQDAQYKEKGVYTNPWNKNNILNHYAISDYLMAPSKYVLNADLLHGEEVGRILYNPYGVNINKFKITNKPHNDSFDVIFVGNWSFIKGCDILEGACRRIGAKLLHVGKIFDIPFPQEDLFTHVDFVSEQELPKYFAKAKTFILPSRNEGFGMVLLQAAACGLPVIGSTRTGLPDLMQLLNKDEGLFLIEEPLSVETIRKALISALEYANALPEGERAQYINRDNLSWEAYGERYYNILKTLKH